MKKDQKLFRLYADHPHASNLSIAGGAAKLLSVFLMVAAIPCTLALLLSAFRITMAGGFGTALIFLMDELDDELVMAFFLWGTVVACRYVASVLQEKADLLVQKNHTNMVTIPKQDTTMP